MRRWELSCTADGNVKWFAIGHTGLKSVLCDNHEGWDVEGDGREVKEGADILYLWLIRVDVWQKPKQYCKAIILQLKKTTCKRNCLWRKSDSRGVLGICYHPKGIQEKSSNCKSHRDPYRWCCQHHFFHKGKKKEAWGGKVIFPGHITAQRQSQK